MSTLSYKVGVKTARDADWITNGLRFASRDEAEDYARNLAIGWTAVREWTVIPSTDAPNR